MQVVGITTQQEVYIASRERKFRINEILILEDADLNNPRGEVVETLAYNRLIPMGLDKSLVDAQVIRSLEQIGYNIDSDEINLAKLRLYEEAPHPVRTGCSVRLPRFEEVRNLLVKTTPQEGMLLGEIRGTESLADSLSEDLANQVVIMEQGDLRSQQGVPFLFDIKTMQQYPHVGVFGGSGSGKSFGLRVMLEELMKLKIPTIVFDPHFEMDFSDRVPGLEDRGCSFTERFVSVQVGQQAGISFSHLSTRDITELLGAAGGHLTESMINVVQMLHRRRDSYTSFSDRLNNLVQALEEGKHGLERQLRNADLTPAEAARVRDLMQLLQQYGTLPLSSVKGIHWRLNRLEKAGLFQHDIRTIEQGMEQGKLVVVQGNAWILQVFATYVIGALYRKRREYKDARMNGEEGHFFPPFVVVTDEAHNFAPKAIDSPAKSILKEIAQEGRKYGVFLFLATQRPTLLDETITAQLNTKFVFRTVRGTDIATLREETDLTPEEGKRLPYLRSGDTFVSSAVFGRTIFIRIRCAYTRSPHLDNPFDELKQKSNERDERVLQTISAQLPMFDTDLVQAVAQVNRECGLNWDVARLKQELDHLAGSGRLKKHETPFTTRYDK
ncbi:ATP-binding protein [Paenactinomyces guangxiensis]|uniref:ATP-binding protein n=1 Tax=Paenactinomyces guangxiensis TaxID=1490290 RepID=A0A7W1WTM1_9BACL|nr:ATP-binding protein [Paenactinomyces guangxiensis]MBA4495835.1 ATP-binding protein [Paenactinomyces guangxiensis]MBH8592925.1 ATP-binding protein [Paenactinomyces guangxiensis]